MVLYFHCVDGKECQALGLPLHLLAKGNIRNGLIVRIDGDSVEVLSAVTTEKVVA